jgi:two-component system chemotaxis sensor kinase CheA
VLKDRVGFVEFFNEARGLVESIRDDDFASDADRRRAVHTLKGNASLYDVFTVVTAAHDLEQAFEDASPQKISEYREVLVRTWDAFAQRAVSLLGEDVGDRIELTQAELEELLAFVRAGASKEELQERISRLAFEPMQVRLTRFGDQLVALATRLRKPQPRVSIDGGGIRLPAAVLAPLWATFAHLIRNVVDHGLDEPDTRAKHGKPAQPSVSFSVMEEKRGIKIVVRDDGKGIDWEGVRARAKERKLSHATQQDLVAALLSPGFSTTDVVTATSGRGVGLSAVYRSVTDLGGTLSIESVRGKGTSFSIELSHEKLAAHGAMPRLSNRPLSESPERPTAALPHYS